MSTVQFLFVGFGEVNIKRLTLVDERSTVGSHLNDDTLRDLPDSLVQKLDVIGNTINVLYLIKQCTQFINFGCNLLSSNVGYLWWCIHNWLNGYAGRFKQLDKAAFKTRIVPHHCLFILHITLYSFKRSCLINTFSKLFSLIFLFLYLSFNTRKIQPLRHGFHPVVIILQST